MCGWSLVSYWAEDVRCIINVAESWVKRLQTEKPSEVIRNKLYLSRVNMTSSLLLGAVEPPSLSCPWEVIGHSGVLVWVLREPAHRAHPSVHSPRSSGWYLGNLSKHENSKLFFIFLWSGI